MRSSRRFRCFVAGTACFVCVVGLAMVSLMSHSNTSSIGLLSPDEMGMVYGGGSESDTCGTSNADSQPCQPYVPNVSYVFETQNPTIPCEPSGTDRSGLTTKEEDTEDVSHNKRGVPTNVDCTRPFSYSKLGDGDPGVEEYNGSCVLSENPALY